jgi:hypothetical protein
MRFPQSVSVVTNPSFAATVLSGIFTTHVCHFHEAGCISRLPTYGMKWYKARQNNFLKCYHETEKEKDK